MHKAKAPSKTKRPETTAAGASESLRSADLILSMVQKIPRGKVSTYGAVADAAGLPRRARLVGTVLRQTSRRVPWHRVMNASGRISFPEGSEAYLEQRARLEREGVLFIGGRVDLKRYGWPSQLGSLDEYMWKL